MPRQGLTKIRERILRFIHEQKEDTGIQPTVRDIMDFMGYRSTNAVSIHVNAMIKSGHLLKVPGRARNLHITEKAKLELGLSEQVPLLGSVSAGTGILAEENVETYLPDLGGGESFVLRVRGDSMKDAGIYEDDLVYVEQKALPRNGDIVVALVENEATIKVYENHENVIRLIPRNSSYKVQSFNSEDEHRINIVGVVKHLLRRY
uniref:SOS-response transcriptional repressor n=1 Tax=Uncultured bacterium HF130_AEPn_1 TaxID=663362 RepID=D0E8J3_UNCHF|nr:SOS-response transcriptional repressor [uncultured bacterium HF130_AEPn_1]